MKIESLKLDELKPLEHNVRKHNEKQINELIRSLEQFGQTRAMVIDENNNILIGNGLYFALKKMGKNDVQCYRMSGLSEIQKKKLILTDNKVYSLGGDDFEQIQNYIADITISGDFDIAGFDEVVIKTLVMDGEEFRDEMNDYGNINDTRYIEEEEQNPQPILHEQKPQPIINEQKPTTIVTETQVQPKAERRYVICSNCGEVIYLD